MLQASERVEIDVDAILIKDGVKTNNFTQENQEIFNIKNYIADADDTQSWSYRAINTENNSATLISQLPGEGNRIHYHPDWNEWWFILNGEWEFEIEGIKHVIREGDLVFIQKRKWHKITVLGDKVAVRLAVSRDGVKHVYKGKEV